MAVRGKAPNFEGFGLLEREIRYAMSKSTSNSEAARYLGISYSTYKKYAKLYVDADTGLTLFELQRIQVNLPDVNEFVLFRDWNNRFNHFGNISKQKPTPKFIWIKYSKAIYPPTRKYNITFYLSREKARKDKKIQGKILQVPFNKNYEESAPATNFLSDFASIGANEPQKTPEVKENNIEVKDLKWRLENLEFKLEQLIEKVNSINRE
jgi:hypothetical protein